MGTLTPGATLIYESPDKGKTVYAREAGTDKKTLVGYAIPTEEDKLKEEWLNVLSSRHFNAELKSAIDACLEIYRTPIFYHPV